MKKRIGMSRKKKPMSTIKSLEVRDRLDKKINQTDIFFKPHDWELHRAKAIDEQSGLVGLMKHELR